jgi:DNA-binding response OmpR family regulator
MQTLLVIDSSPMTRRLVELTFVREGVRVLEAGDSGEALALARAERPDVVLAGETTASGSEYEMAARLKSDPDLSGVPVLLLTGAYAPLDEARVSECRCDGVLVKPFAPGDIVARVREVASASARAAGATPRAPLASGQQRHDLTSVELGARASAARDAYFDRLDAALGRLGQAGQADPPVASPHALDDQVRPPTVEDLLGAPQDRPASVETDSRAAPLGDELIEEVARRVADRLAREFAHEVATGIARSAARLLREELERIRSERDTS